METQTDEAKILRRLSINSCLNCQIPKRDFSNKDEMIEGVKALHMKFLNTYVPNKYLQDDVFITKAKEAMFEYM